MDRRAAIHTEGLSKRYGDTLALDGLDLDGAARARCTATSAPTAPARRRRSGCCSACTARAAGARSCSASTPGATRSRAHRRRRLRRRRAVPVAGADERRDVRVPRAPATVGTDVAYRDELVERFQLDTRKKIRALSKGNRQKVQLIAALATRAELLLLDEPTSGLDPLMEMAFRECVKEAKERGQTVFLSSHILSEVEALCDRVGILRAGQARRRGHAAGAAPPRRADGRGHVRGPGAGAAAAAGGARRRAPARTRCASRSRARSAR